MRGQKKKNHAAKGPFKVRLLLCHVCGRSAISAFVLPLFTRSLLRDVCANFRLWRCSRRPFVGERGAEAAPEPDHGGELRPAGEGGHHLGRGQAAAGRTRRRPRLSPSPPSRPVSHLSLPPQLKCCGSSGSGDWLTSRYVTRGEAEGRVVPDSCCKTSTRLCGRRDHPSNIYKVEVSAPPSGLCFDWLLVWFDLVGLLAFAGRLHLQAGAVPGRSPPGYRSGGGRSGLPAGNRASAALHYQSWL